MAGELPSANGTATLTLSFTSASPRTLLPDIDMRIASYDVLCIGPEGATLNHSTTSSSLVVDVAAGQWTVSVNAKNQAGTIIEQGSATVTVNTGIPATCSVTVSPLSGYGSLQLTAAWKAGDLQAPSIQAHLLPPSGAPMPLAFTIGAGIATYQNANIPTGYYSLSLQLLDGGILTMGAVEDVRIVEGQTTSGTFDFSHLNIAPLSLRPIDGGANYYAQWPNSFPTDPSYFPIGVWFDSVTEQGNIDLDKDAGLNLYVALTANSDLQLLAANGMRAILQSSEWLGQANAAGSQAIAGWLLGDEIDMTHGPGPGLGGGGDGYTVMANAKAALPVGDGRFSYANFGVGVCCWETEAEAAYFVNTFQDAMSADQYWFTVDDLMQQSQGGKLLGLGRPLTYAESHRACNYGRTTDRIRALLSPQMSKPVFGYVEVAMQNPSYSDILPEQVVAAAWSHLIHGARGIVYFSHAFGGPKGYSQHCLREAPWATTRAAVKDVNARIKALAPVLNAPFVDGLVTTSGGVDLMAKWYGGRFYLFVQSTQPDSINVTLSMPSVGNATATVLDENRSISVLSGSFTDSFSDSNAVHVYRIDGGATGGLAP